MLVHKATMGVLDRIWTGRHTRGADGVLIPVDRQAVLSDIDDPENWWEVPNTGPLARRIRLHYPFLRPVVDGDGRLVDVVLLGAEEDPRAAEEAEAAKSARAREAARRGYQKTGRVRPLGLMPFLSCTQTCNNGKKTSK